MSKELSKIIFADFDKPERLEAFYEVKDSIRTKRQYWRLFADIWANSESLYMHYDIINEILNDEALQTGKHHYMMNKEEEEKFNTLPDTITIYRGCWKKNKKGFSWTLDKTQALWFAKRHAPDGQPIILKGKIAKGKVFALLLERSENEIVTRYDYVDQIRETRLPKQEVSNIAVISQAAHAGTFYTEEMQEAIEQLRFQHMADHWEESAIARNYDERIDRLQGHGFLAKATLLTEEKKVALAYYAKTKKAAGNF